MKFIIYSDIKSRHIAILLKRAVILSAVHGSSITMNVLPPPSSRSSCSTSFAYSCRQSFSDPSYWFFPICLRFLEFVLFSLVLICFDSNWFNRCSGSRRRPFFCGISKIMNNIKRINNEHLRNRNGFILIT